MRDIDVGQRLAVGGSEALTQAQKETSDLLMRIDAAVQKSLSVVFGFSPSAADLATSMMAWVTSCLIGFAALFSLLQNMAPPSIRQRLITGHSGAGARTGGTFELPH
jgi:hypothetical protein